MTTIDKTIPPDTIGEMATLYNSNQVAEMLGIARVTVNKRARVNSIGSVVGNQRVFTPADVKAMSKLKTNRRGRPTDPDSKYHGWREKRPTRRHRKPKADQLAGQSGQE